jgi:hypothetical protein
VLRIEPRTSSMLAKLFITELHPQSPKFLPILIANTTHAYSLKN